jgi:hypothetical protein
MSNLPVIFMAFANEQEQASAHLRGLAAEQRGLANLLDRAKDKGVCEYVVKYNATVQDIFDTFQKESLRGRICIFHYAGHANSFQLLLESAEGGNQAAHAQGLVEFLSRQEGLKLAFLNACATQGQVQALLSRGVPAIATDRSIADRVATEFALRLYQGLAAELTLRQAFDDAASYVVTFHGDAPTALRDLSWEGSGEEPASGQPWHLLLPSGQEALGAWSLKAAREALATEAKQDFRAEVHALLAKGRLEQALKTAHEGLKGTEWEQDALGLLGQFKQLARQERNGLLSFENAQLGQNRITAALIGLLQDTVE